ncbi:hypothetical protein CH340_24465 [Rhodoplanes serenus]|nr:hypothetical protein CH340_24465 [Rhodoplanes serenus]
MTADQAAQREMGRDYSGVGRAAQAELVLRNALETFLRGRRSDARICHEMVMGEGKVRADVVAVAPDHIIACEVKGQFDDTSRLLHQVCMYQLCVPEVWMVVATGHVGDARLIRHLLPSVGLLVGSKSVRERGELRYDLDDGAELLIEAEAVPRPVVPDMMLRMCWAAELLSICRRLRLDVGTKPTRAKMVAKLLNLDTSTLQREVCTELRSRDALWRADPPYCTVRAAASPDARPS